MFKKLRKKLSRRGKYTSPYYTGVEALGSAPAAPLRQDPDPVPVNGHVAPHEPIPCPKPNAVDWEQRRFELLKMLLAQERRSVVLGKLQASNKQIANTARVLADAGIRELMKHPMELSDETGGETTDE